MSSSREQPLRGGNVSAGVVRVGDTVRRPAGLWEAGHGEAWRADTAYLEAREAAWAGALLA